MAFKNWMKQVYVATVAAAVMAVGCGQDDSMTTPKTCAIDLRFTGVERAGDFDELVYSAPLSSECSILASQQNGAMSYALETSEAQAFAFVSTLDLGGGRAESFTEDLPEARLFGSGSVIRREFVSADYSRPGLEVWLFPWQNIPEKATVKVRIVAGALAESYPKGAKITLSSTSR